MPKPTIKVMSLGHLRELCEETPFFVIRLNGGLNSSKEIEHNQKFDVFYVTNSIDGSEQILYPHEMLDKSKTMIGEAIRVGAFYAEFA